jgi:hypothetical protein
MGNAPRITGGVIPANVLARMSPADRPKGVAGMLPDELRKKFTAGQEDKLQQAISQYLRVNNIEFINPAMNKRSQLPIGWPDFTFAYRGRAIAVEAKTVCGSLSMEQKTLHPKLTANGWLVVMAHSVADVQSAMRSVDSIIGDKCTAQL